MAIDLKTTGPAVHLATLPDPQDKFLRTEHLRGDLRGRFISGTFVTGAAQAGKFILTLVSTAILARLLGPKDFGLVAMVTVVTAFLRVFKDAGLSTATIQRHDLTQAQVSNLFWINVALGGLLGVIVAALAPALAWFYHDPRVADITRLLSITFLISGATVQPQALLNRQMRFKALACIDLGSLVASVGLGIGMASLGCGYWSLVGAGLAMEGTGLLITLLVSHWRPQLPKRRSGTWPLVSFGAHLTLGNTLFLFSRGMDSALIGRFYGPVSVGLYSRAMALLIRPLDQFLTPIGAVFLPALSHLQSEPERYRRAFLQVYEAISLLGFLGTAVIIPLARPVTLVLLGPKWEDASVIFCGLAFAALPMPLAWATNWLFTSQGRGRDLLICQVVSAVVTIVFFVVGLRWGPAGVALGFSASVCLVRAPLLFYMAGRRGPVRTADLWREFGKNSRLWAVVLGATWLARHFLNTAGPAAQLAICAPVGLLVGAVIILVSPQQRRVATKICQALRSCAKPPPDSAAA